ncbi:MAG: trehalose-phosphatase [Chloroflexi bacterium]|nr:trehalose-phosphatase [Chloroflexota bacterium]
MRGAWRAGGSTRPSRGRLSALRACREALASRPAGLVTDIDGTISPIVQNPAAAAVLPGCRDALAVLARRLDLVAVLTGREPDVARRMVGLEGVEYLGTHGMVRWTPDGLMVHPDAAPFAERISQALPSLLEQLKSTDASIEDKGLVLAIHFRQSTSLEGTRDTIIAGVSKVAKAHGLAVMEGRKVVELRPPLHLGKGWSLADLARERQLASLVYLGDDRTDIPAFETIRQWRASEPGRQGVALAVASGEMAPELADLADYTLADVPAVESLLRNLAREA